MQSDKANEVVKSQTDHELYNVPLSLAVSQCIVSVVKDQYLIINKCLIHMIFRRLRLLAHLEALRHLFMFYAGDILSLFMSSTFNDDFDSSLKESSLSFVNNQFEMAIKMSLPNFNGGSLGEQAA